MCVRVDRWIDGMWTAASEKVKEASAEGFGKGLEVGMKQGAEQGMKQGIDMMQVCLHRPTR